MKLVLFFLLAFTCCCFGQQLYSLKVEFLNEDIGPIRNAGQYVGLSRQVAPGQWATLWASFSPFPNNYISWNTSGLGVYAAIAPPQNGHVIFVGSFTQTFPDLVYPFVGYFGSPFSPKFPMSPGEIAIYNNGSTSYTFGQTSDIVINGETIKRVPISAETLLSYEHAFFQENENVFIFLGLPTPTGTIVQFLPQVALSKISQLSFSPSSPTLTVQWDSVNGRFIKTA